MKGKPFDLVYPWNIERFVGTETQKSAVMSNILRVGLSLSNWGKEPESRIVVALEQVMTKAIMPQSNRWQLICSNSVMLLQALAELCPIIFSLTTHDSSIRVSTDKLVERFIDDTAVDRRDDIAWQAKDAGFMCWAFITQPHSSGNRYHYKFSEILLKRSRLGYPTVFLATYTSGAKKFSEDSVDFVCDKISQALGDTVGLLIQEVASVQYFETVLETKELTKISL